MLRRKMMDTLTEWKKTKKKECLLVNGARQVGKTFIIREFGKQNYDSVIEINFMSHSKFKKAFAGDLSMDNIISEITLIERSFKFIPGRTLLFLDEIQECGDARTALKFIAEDDRFDCIASGSMLGIAYKTTRSVPVGFEKEIKMHPLDFEEFQWALGFEDDAIQYLREFYDKRKNVSDSVNDAMLSRLRLYAIVGGMPAVVNKYLETNNFGLVHEEQKKIISSYLSDLTKYLKVPERVKARDCYLSVPAQLAKENKKFQYSVVEKGGRAGKYGNSLEWLRDAGLVEFCNNVSIPLFPLPSYSETDHFKIYLTDIGILNSMYGFDMKSAVYNNTLTGPAKGGIYENLIADILIKKGIPLNYYKPCEGMQEIEFLLTVDAAVIPLEVKSGRGRTVSLDEFIKRFDPPYALKLISGNAGQDGKKVTLPLWMAMFL